MRGKELVKLFIIVFVVAFVANVAVAYLWDMVFHDRTGFRWDTTSATAASVGIVVAFILARRRDS